MNIRASTIWTLLIAILGIFIIAGSLPLDISSQRTAFGLVAAGITVGAGFGTLLVFQRYVRSVILVGCAAGFIVLLLSTHTLTNNSRLPVSIMIAVLLAITLTTLRTGDVAQDGWIPMELFAAMLIVLTPIWGLYSVPMTYAHDLGLWPTATIYLVALWGVPIALAGYVSRLKTNTSRELLLNVVTGAVSTLLTLAVLEGAVRVIGLDQVDSRTYEIIIKSTLRNLGTPEFPGDYVPNQTGEEQVLTYDFWGRVQSHTVTYSINNAGFRDVDFVMTKPPDTYRIALLGDSFAFGLGAQQNKIVAYLIGPMLSQATGCNVQVYNFGVSAYATVNEAALFKNKVIAYDPDMVIVWYFLNDPNLKGTTIFLGKFDTQSFFPIAKNYSSLAHLAALRFGAVLNTRTMIGVYRDGYALDDNRWLTVVSSLKSMSELAYERNITPALFVHPVLFQLDDNYPFKDIHAQVIQTAESAGFHSFDLFDAFKGQPADVLWVSPANQHPNETAHAIAARYVVDKLKNLIPACKK